MSCVVRFSSAAVSWGWRGRSHGHLSGWWDGAPGPTSVAASLPGALGTAEAGRLDSRVTLLLLLGLPAPSPQLDNWIAGSAPHELKAEMTPWFMQNRSVSRHETNINLIVPLPQSS